MSMLDRWFRRRATPARREEVATLATAQDDFFQAFDELFRTRLATLRGGEAGAVFNPRVDVSEDAESVIVTAELPGMARDDITLTVEDEGLLLEGEKRSETTEQDEDRGWYRAERTYGSFRRWIPLPARVDEENVFAEFNDGVLTVRAPKSEPPTPVGARKVEIR